MTWTKEIPAHPVVAVAGATGAVGAEFLQVLHDVDFPAAEVRALASARARSCRFWGAARFRQASSRCRR